MNKQQEGIVIEELPGQRAKIKASRHGDCENCGACPGDNALIIEANNSIGSKKGDKIIFEASEQSMLKAAFIVYMFPLLLTFIGSYIALLLSDVFGGNAKTFQIVGGFTAFFISILLIYSYEKKSKSNISKLPTIIKIRD